MRRVFSGIQPTGVPHLGNYLGAIRNWVELQAPARDARPAGLIAPSPRDTLFCIVDLHAMTTPFDPATLARTSVTTAAVLLACGVSPASSTLFRQSAVREHAELAWLLSCVTPLGWLQRMTQFKAKGAGSKAAAPLGLLSYPVLQAADILLYRATHVPVGEDQHQHLELARDVAAAFNARFCGGGVHDGGGGALASERGAGVGDGRGASCPPFPLPATLSVAQAGACRVMSLRDAGVKMSKSAPDDASRINLTDSAEAIREKVRRAKTDSTPGFTFDPAGRPDKANLLAIFGALVGEHPATLAERYAASSSGAFKEELGDALVAALCPIGEEVRRLTGSETGRRHVEDVLQAGEATARGIAGGVMQDVRAAVGIR